MTQEIEEPNGSPIPMDSKPIATLGGVVYAALTRVPAESHEEAETCYDLAARIVGLDEFEFSTQELALVQSRVKGLSLTILRVPAARMLELKKAGAAASG